MKVALLFGGVSSEHEVSLQSALNIYNEMDRNIFDVLLVAIDKDGTWMSFENEDFLQNKNDPSKINLNRNKGIVFYKQGDKKNANFEALADVDVAFSVIHGSQGEDGRLQGFFEVLGIPIVGSSVMSSSMCMDKDVTKIMLKAKGVKVTEGLTLKKSEEIPKFERIVTKYGLPLFVKPSREGSSVGVSKVTNEIEFDQGLTYAFGKDNKILIEQGIEGREIEVAVIGDECPEASIPGEIIPKKGFYSYDEKYLGTGETETCIPAKLNEEEMKKVREIAVKAYKAMECRGMARVDFFLNEEGEWIVNEINTIPGFTKISMYPKLWENSGLPYEALIKKLIRICIKKE